MGRFWLSRTLEVNRKAVIMKNNATLLSPRCTNRFDAGGIHSPWRT